MLFSIIFDLVSHGLANGVCVFLSSFLSIREGVGPAFCRWAHALLRSRLGPAPEDPVDLAQDGLVPVARVVLCRRVKGVKRVNKITLSMFISSLCKYGLEGRLPDPIPLGQPSCRPPFPTTVTTGFPLALLPSGSLSLAHRVSNAGGFGTLFGRLSGPRPG